MRCRTQTTAGGFCKLPPRYAVEMRIIDVAPGYRRRGEWDTIYLCSRHLKKLRREVRPVGNAVISKQTWGDIAQVVQVRNVREL